MIAAKVRRDTAISSMADTAITREGVLGAARESLEELRGHDDGVFWQALVL